MKLYIVKTGNGTFLFHPEQYLKAYIFAKKHNSLLEVWGEV